MDTRTPYKHDFRALPSVPGLRQRPSCRISDFLTSPISTDTLFSLIGEATFQRKGESLTRTIQALLSLRNPRKRLSRSTIQTLRTFQPMMPFINHDTIARLDTESRAVWRHNVIVRMIHGQRGVEETMRLLRIAPAEPEPEEELSAEPDPAIYRQLSPNRWERIADHW